MIPLRRRIGDLAVSESFFERPIPNSPYVSPDHYWGLDAEGQPTARIVDCRRGAELVTPVPKPRKRRFRAAGHPETVFDGSDRLPIEEREHSSAPIINEIRGYVEAWHNPPNRNPWQVTPETTRLLRGWRHHRFENLRPFYCQIEAAETAIWLAEVASDRGAASAKIWTYLRGANKAVRPELFGVALKLATDAGKTKVMAELIRLADRQLAVGDLMRIKNIVVLNDEAHHCHREKPQAEGSEKLRGGAKEGGREQRVGANASLGHRDLSNASSALPPSTSSQRRVFHARLRLGVRMTPDCMIEEKVEPARRGMSVAALFEDSWKGYMSWRRL
jgi:hypothetical protein